MLIPLFPMLAPKSILFSSRVKITAVFFAPIPLLNNDSDTTMSAFKLVAELKEKVKEIE